MASFSSYVVVGPAPNVAVPAGPADWGSQPVVSFAPGVSVSKGAIVVTGDSVTSSAGQYLVPISKFWVVMQTHVLGAQPRLWQSDEFLHFSLGSST